MSSAAAVAACPAGFSHDKRLKMKAFKNRPFKRHALSKAIDTFSQRCLKGR
jgi:hypothetical protein